MTTADRWVGVRAGRIVNLGEVGSLSGDSMGWGRTILRWCAVVVGGGYVMG